MVGKDGKSYPTKYTPRAQTSVLSTIALANDPQLRLLRSHGRPVGDEKADGISFTKPIQGGEVMMVG